MRRRKKIFRPKRRYKIKRNNGSAVKIITGTAALAVLVFVGYSAAGPINNYFKEKAEQSESREWTPENTDAPSVPDVSETEIGAVTEITFPQESAVTSVSETEITSVTEDIPASSEIKSGGAAYSLRTSDMADMETLSAALSEARAEGASAVIIPMKTEGGLFWYATDIPFAKTAIDGEDPIKSQLTAKQISDAARSEGLRPVAYVSVLTDNNRYGDYRDGSYRSLDDSTWLDTSPDKGGKPWISPFDEVAQQYLCDTMTELGEAGFSEIIADDFTFPEFRSSDIELLGEQVSPYSDRYHALTALASMMTEAGNNAGARVMLRITANSVIKGYSELFHPEELAGCTILIDYSEDNISRTMISAGEEVILDDLEMPEKVRAVFSEVISRCGDIPTYPMLDRGSMEADDFSGAVSALTAVGYEEYYIY